MHTYGKLYVEGFGLVDSSSLTVVEECSRYVCDMYSVEVQEFGLMVDGDGEVLTKDNGSREEETGNNKAKVMRMQA